MNLNATLDVVVDVSPGHLRESTPITSVVGRNRSIADRRAALLSTSTSKVEFKFKFKFKFNVK
jgi:hypothetical protein